MKKFIYNLVVFGSLIAIGFVFVCSQANGYTDPFYVRFTTPKQDNLIIATSGAAQGIQPAVLNKVLNKSFFNYAFTLGHSPYGQTYLNSITKKLNTEVKDAIFILTVDPWSISSWTDEPNDSMNFRELKLCLGNTGIVNMNPNLIYLFNNYDENIFNLIKKKDTHSFLHNDGWLEININMNDLKVQKRTELKEKTYKEDYMPKTKFSETRLRYLQKTISYLQDYGKVYLVRLPIDSRIRKIENEYMPDFENKIQNVVRKSSGYLNFSKEDDDYQYVDGNHLYKKSGAIVTKKIADWIKHQEICNNE